MLRVIFFNLLLLTEFGTVHAAIDPTTLLAGVKKKYDLVNNYSAVAQLKTNVLFIKAPVSLVTIYYRKPDKLKIKNQKGVSFIPKGTVNINLNNVLGLQNFEAIDAGTTSIDGITCQILKVFPINDAEEITRATLYIDPARLVVLRSLISTRENGTYEIQMRYGAYTNWGLPDKVVVEFNTRDFKLPKGTTLDYDNGSAKNSSPKGPQKGKVEILYKSYLINKGVTDAQLQ